MEMSSQKAASLVNMPRFELEQLLADGIIPSRRVDGQRVVDLDRVIAHKNHEDTLRLIRADFLLAEDHLPDEDHGLGRDI